MLVAPLLGPSRKSFDIDPSRLGLGAAERHDRSHPRSFGGTAYGFIRSPSRTRWRASQTSLPNPTKLVPYQRPGPPRTAVDRGPGSRRGGGARAAAQRELRPDAGPGLVFDGDEVLRDV